VSLKNYSLSGIRPTQMIIKKHMQTTINSLLWAGSLFHLPQTLVDGWTTHSLTHSLTDSRLNRCWFLRSHTSYDLPAVSREKMFHCSVCIQLLPFLWFSYQTRVLIILHDLETSSGQYAEFYKFLPYRLNTLVKQNDLYEVSAGND
jgi:hypothetical protein